MIKDDVIFFKMEMFLKEFKLYFFFNTFISYIGIGNEALKLKSKKTTLVHINQWHI